MGFVFSFQEFKDFAKAVLGSVNEINGYGIFCFEHFWNFLFMTTEKCQYVNKKMPNITIIQGHTLQDVLLITCSSKLQSKFTWYNNMIDSKLDVWKQHVELWFRGLSINTSQPENHSVIEALLIDTTLSK